MFWSAWRALCAPSKPKPMHCAANNKEAEREKQKGASAITNLTQLRQCTCGEQHRNNRDHEHEQNSGLPTVRVAFGVTDAVVAPTHEFAVEACAGAPIAIDWIRS